MAGYSVSGSYGQSQSQSAGESSSNSFIPDYSETPILEGIANQAQAMSSQVYNWGMNQFNTTQGNIDSMMRDALSYASPQRISTDMGMAESGVQQGVEAARQSAITDLQSYGIDPSSGRYAALDEANRVMGAASAAGAGNQQRMADIAAGNAMRNQAISASEQNNTFGLGVGNSANSFLTTAMNLKYPPLGTTAQSQQHAASESTNQSQSHSVTTNPPQNPSQPKQPSQPSSGGGGAGKGAGGGGNKGAGTGGGGGGTASPPVKPAVPGTDPGQAPGNMPGGGTPFPYPEVSDPSAGGGGYPGTGAYDPNAQIPMWGVGPDGQPVGTTPNTQGWGPMPSGYGPDANIPGDPNFNPENTTVPGPSTDTGNYYPPFQDNTPSDLPADPTIPVQGPTDLPPAQGGEVPIADNSGTPTSFGSFGDGGWQAMRPSENVVDRTGETYTPPSALATVWQNIKDNTSDSVGQIQNAISGDPNAAPGGLADQLGYNANLAQYQPYANDPTGGAGTTALTGIDPTTGQPLVDQTQTGGAPDGTAGGVDLAGGFTPSTTSPDFSTTAPDWSGIFGQGDTTAPGYDVAQSPDQIAPGEGDPWTQQPDINIPDFSGGGGGAYGAGSTSGQFGSGIGGDYSAQSGGGNYGGTYGGGAGGQYGSGNYGGNYIGQGGNYSGGSNYAGGSNYSGQYGGNYIGQGGNYSGGSNYAGGSNYSGQYGGNYIGQGGNYSGGSNYAGGSNYGGNYQPDTSGGGGGSNYSGGGNYTGNYTGSDNTPTTDNTFDPSAGGDSGGSYGGGGGYARGGSVGRRRTMRTGFRPGIPHMQRGGPMPPGMDRPPTPPPGMRPHPARQRGRPGGLLPGNFISANGMTPPSTGGTPIGRPTRPPPGIQQPRQLRQRPPMQGFAGGGQVADPTTGGFVSKNLSPSSGSKTDDVNAKLNAGEFVIPKDVAAWEGKKFFYNLIAKARKMRAAGQKPEQAKVGYAAGGPFQQPGGRTPAMPGAVGQPAPPRPMQQPPTRNQVARPSPLPNFQTPRRQTPMGPQ